MRTRGNGSGSVFKRAGRKPWYISWYDANGDRHTHCTRTTDKTAALRILSNKVADVALRRDGVIDARQEAIAIQGKIDIESHLAGFEAKMQMNQCSEKHVRTTMKLVREICKAAGFTKAADITLDAVSKHVQLLTNRSKKVSARTVQARIVAMKSFVHWLIETDKLAMNPLVKLKRGDAGKNRSMRRRMLLPDEWPWLQRGVVLAGTAWGMSPFERIALYATAIQTGFRSAELRSLICADLSINTPALRGRAESMKNGQEARQHVQPDLARQLAVITAQKRPEASLFDLPSEFDMAQMLRDDLARARELWIAAGGKQESDFLRATNHQGEVLDFHALRHTCGAWLAINGIHPKTIQAVMRHSTITLTMDTYGHLLPDAHADAIAAMLMPMAATAATEAAIELRPTAMNSEQQRRLAEIGESLKMVETLKFPGENAETAGKSGENDNTSCRARTCDPLIKRHLSDFVSSEPILSYETHIPMASVRIAAAKKAS